MILQKSGCIWERLTNPPKEYVNISMSFVWVSNKIPDIRCLVWWRCQEDCTKTPFFDGDQDCSI